MLLTVEPNEAPKDGKVDCSDKIEEEEEAGGCNVVEEEAAGGSDVADVVVMADTVPVDGTRRNIKSETNTKSLIPR